jgi:hypothetical protein
MHNTVRISHPVAFDCFDKPLRALAQARAAMAAHPIPISPNTTRRNSIDPGISFTMPQSAAACKHHEEVRSSTLGLPVQLGCAEDFP